MKTLSPLLPQPPGSGGQSIAPAASSSDGNPFSLETTDNAAALIQRLAQGKSSAEKHSPGDADDGAAMQAMLAMLLTPPGAPESVTRRAQPLQADNHIALHLAHAQLRTASQTDALAQWLTAKPHADAQPDASASRLPVAELQKVFASLVASGDVNLTPQQQSQLAVLRAQDPQQVGQATPGLSLPGKVSQHITAASAAAPRLSRLKEKVADQRVAAPVTAAALSPAAAMNSYKMTNVAMEAPAPLSFSAEEWAEKLTSLLKDRIHFQIDQHQQISTIRLDPPSLGKLEIAIQMEAGKLAVHINASQPDVGRSLQQLSEQLRQQLTGQNFTQVEVNVATGGGSERHQQQQHHSRQDDDEILMARTVSATNTVDRKHDPLLIKV